MFTPGKAIIYTLCAICVILFLLVVYKKHKNFKHAKLPDKIAILYCGNIDKTLKNWPTVIENHIFLYRNIFPTKKLDLFFVVDDIEPKKLLINDFLRKNTVNIICTNTNYNWKPTSILTKGNMDPNRIDEFKKRITKRGLDFNKIVNIRNTEQFHKLSIAINLKREYESIHKFKYEKCVKNRTDLIIEPSCIQQMVPHFENHPDMTFFHLSDLFFITPSDTMNKLSNFLDHIYTHDEYVIKDFMILLKDNLDNYRYDPRLFPETQFLTYVAYLHSNNYNINWILKGLHSENFGNICIRILR